MTALTVDLRDLDLTDVRLQRGLARLAAELQRVNATRTRRLEVGSSQPPCRSDVPSG